MSSFSFYSLVIPGLIIVRSACWVLGSIPGLVCGGEKEVKGSCTWTGEAMEACRLERVARGPNSAAAVSQSGERGEERARYILRLDTLVGTHMDRRREDYRAPSPWLC